nr:TetR/AcrR family transcriptional regulator [Williamsia sterculiae]
MRADAMRNRQLLLDAAQQLIDNQGAAAVTMDAVARQAGVGKGTVFRRFGSRTGLMHALLNHSESELQQAFLSGPAPLGPGAPPLDRLLAYGRARLKMTAAHLELLLEAESTGAARFSHPVSSLSTAHVRLLLHEMGFREGLEVLALAVLAPLQPAAYEYLTDDIHVGFEEITAQWEHLVRALIPDAVV